MGRFFIFFLFMFLIGCEEKSNMILADKDFDEGDWLFVNVNYVEDTHLIIDNEELLKRNSQGIRVLPGGECGGTTCDGFLMLYKDGQLIEQQEYLEKSELFESDSLISCYIQGKSLTINPTDKKDFDLKWDSLKRIKDVYPTVYHTQPGDKDIILVYELEM